MSIETLVKKIEKRFDRSLCVPGYFHFYEDNNVKASVRCNPKTGYWIASLDGDKLKRPLDPEEFFWAKRSLDPEEALKALLDQLEGEREFESFEKLGESLSIHHYD